MALSWAAINNNSVFVWMFFLRSYTQIIWLCEYFTPVLAGGCLVESE